MIRINNNKKMKKNVGVKIFKSFKKSKIILIYINFIIAIMINK